MSVSRSDNGIRLSFANAFSSASLMFCCLARSYKNLLNSLKFLLCAL